MVYDEVFLDSGGHASAYSGYGSSLPNDQSYFVIVRPDGVIGARVHEFDRALFPEDIFLIL